MSDAYRFSDAFVLFYGNLSSRGPDCRPGPCAGKFLTMATVAATWPAVGAGEGGPVLPGEIAQGVGGHGVRGRVRYQARVAAMASASGVPAVPNAAWYLVVSRTNGWSNW